MRRAVCVLYLSKASIGDTGGLREVEKAHARFQDDIRVPLLTDEENGPVIHEQAHEEDDAQLEARISRMADIFKALFVLIGIAQTTYAIGNVSGYW